MQCILLGMHGVCRTLWKDLCCGFISSSSASFKRELLHDAVALSVIVQSCILSRPNVTRAAAGRDRSPVTDVDPEPTNSSLCRHFGDRLLLNFRCLPARTLTKTFSICEAYTTERRLYICSDRLSTWAIRWRMRSCFGQTRVSTIGPRREVTKVT